MRRWIATLMLVAAASLVLPPAVGAGQYEQALQRATAGLKKQDPVALLGGLREAIAAAWIKLPFTVLEARLVSSPPSGFGRYAPRKDNVFGPNEPMFLYVEPVGFKVRYDPDGQTYYYNLSADFNLIDAWGRVISGRRNFSRFSGTSRHFPDQLMLSFTYNLRGLPPGSYRLETVLRDTLGKRAHTVVTPVVVKGE